VAIVSAMQEVGRLRELERRRLQQVLFETEKLAATGRLAASIAHEINNPLEAVQNALYLLGEVAHLSDDVEAARGYFGRLHRDFFPDAGYLPEFLLAVDIRKLVNLHA
jgi:signal transduction histidine kinase